MIVARWRSRRQGFTLMELMVVLAIMSILVTPLIYLEVFYAERYRSTMAHQDMAEAGARVLDWIARDFRASGGLLESRGETRLAGNRLILKGENDRVILYALDEKRNAITRAEHPPGEGAEPMVLTLAEHVAEFRFDPVDPSASMLHIRLRFSREMIHSVDGMTLSCFTSRRVK